MKSQQNETRLKLVKRYILYVFALTGVYVILGVFFFEDEQTKQELVKTIILSLVMAFMIIILDEVKKERELKG